MDINYDVLEDEERIPFNYLWNTAKFTWSSSLKSECAKSLLTKEPAIHLFVNNVGVILCPFEKTEDGFEMQLQTNHLGHFLLTLLLLPKIMSSEPSCKILNQLWDQSHLLHLEPEGDLHTFLQTVSR
ncbi:retinol dehydrogenase 11-like [Odontomachus brunneus]|uniref:retinol dehydrogenase 11-like n=1 Tax=Odontomachus brunneus TaxID=486640 RepID=UPI0013F1A15D|nr:retinol dehydrogenase 11-like [Odontomachus brunneus]